MPELLERLPDLAWLRLDLLGRLLLAALLGGAIGLERELSGKPAGFRTNLLICVGAALLTDLSIAVAQGADPRAMADPGRIAAQIVSGIGFLGAGTIIQSRAGVVGLTTAATLWVVAAIGMAVGAGAFVEAVGTSVLVIVALIALGGVEQWLATRSEFELRVTMSRDPVVVEEVERLLSEGLDVRAIEAERREATLHMTYHVAGHMRDSEGLLDRLLSVAGVHKVVRSR